MTKPMSLVVVLYYLFKESYMKRFIEFILFVALGVTLGIMFAVALTGF